MVYSFSGGLAIIRRCFSSYCRYAPTQLVLFIFLSPLSPFSHPGGLGLLGLILFQDIKQKENYSLCFKNPLLFLHLLFLKHHCKQAWPFNFINSHFLVSGVCQKCTLLKTRVSLLSSTAVELNFRQLTSLKNEERGPCDYSGNPRWEEQGCNTQTHQNDCQPDGQGLGRVVFWFVLFVCLLLLLFFMCKLVPALIIEHQIIISSPETSESSFSSEFGVSVEERRDEDLVDS